MKPYSLGDLFHACYYARDPEELRRLCEKADALEKALKETSEALTESQWRHDAARANAG